MDSLGTRLARAIGDKDRAALTGLMSDGIDFKALTPRRSWEAEDADGIAEIVFGTWFDDNDDITELVDVHDEPDVEDTARVTYRFAVTSPDGPHTVEQTAYYRAEGDRIGYLRVLCSGFRPSPG